MGVALNTGVEVAPRPVMKEGMKGMQGMQGATQGAAGPRRQVLDRSYHLGQLRAKIQELAAELSRLREEEQKFTRNAGSISAFSEKLKKLEKEVGEAKGKYSDLNYAVEKSAGGVDVEKINREAAELREQNKQSKEAGIFKLMERKKCDEKLRLVQQETEKPMIELEERIQKDPIKRKEYHELKELSSKLAGELFVKEKELAELGKTYEELQLSVKSDPIKQQQFVTQEKLHRLRKEREDLSGEFEGDMQQEKAKLLATVKEDVQEIELIQGKMKDAKSELDDAKQKLQDRRENLAELTGDKMEKLKQLEQRDNEMQEFIDKFQTDRQRQLDENSRTEESIVHLLEHISEKLKQGSNMTYRMKEMRDELSGKQRGLQESTSTHERLKNELAVREKELEKVNNLDQKITSELSAINKKINEHDAAMKTYSNLDALRKEHDDRKRRLTASKHHLSRLRDNLKHSVNGLDQAYNKKREDLQKNETHFPLQQQEQKIRDLKKTFFSLETFIKEKHAETHYIPIKSDCVRMTDEINNFLKDPKRLDKTYARRDF